MVWYCVVSSYDDRGRVTAALTDAREQDICPENIFRSTRWKDIYIEWFGSKEEALKYVEDAKRA